MTVPQFPSSLPQIASYDVKPAPQVLASESPGPRAARRRTRDPGAYAQVTWRFFNDQYKTFMDWWRDDLLRGHRWFTINLPSAVGLKPVKARFVKHREVQAGGHKYWIVTADLEILARRISSEIEDVYITTTLYPILFRDLLATQMAVTAGALSPAGYDKEFYTSGMTVAAGNIRVALRSVLFRDNLSPEFTILSGSFWIALRTASFGPDYVNSSFEVMGGSIRRLLITFNVPPDPMTSHMIVAGGSNVTPPYLNQKSAPIENCASHLIVVSGSLHAP